MGCAGRYVLMSLAKTMEGFTLATPVARSELEALCPHRDLVPEMRRLKRLARTTEAGTLYSADWLRQIAPRWAAKSPAARPKTRGPARRRKRKSRV